MRLKLTAVTTILVSVGLLPLCSAKTITAAESPRRPNVVLIVADDMGWWDLRSHGNPAIDTPRLDQLGKEGVTFERFYVEPVCAPTRAGLMTGRHYLRTGLYNTRFGGDTLPDTEVTLAEALKSAGYRTGVFGKWHLGKYVRHQPQNQGFDECLVFLQGHAERYDYPDQFLHNGVPVQTRGYITDLITDAAIEFIEASGDRPYFCCVPYNVPHSPYIVSQTLEEEKPGDAAIAKYLSRGVPLREARIYAMIERCDNNIGRLLDKLSALKQEEHTIVMFLSDNGGVSKHFNAGLRGGKASIFEGGVRSPFLVRYPAKFASGRRIDAMVSHLDVLPTVCDVAGVPTPNVPLDGRSIRTLLEQGEGASPHQYLYHAWDRHRPNPDGKWAINDGRFKLAEGKLYDLTADPSERRDTKGEHPELADKLRKEFLRWFADVTKGHDYVPIPIEAGRADENPVEIQASWATLVGSAIHYTFRAYDWDTIDGWRDPAEVAKWQLDVTAKGIYEVEVSYAAARASAGSQFEVKIGEAKLTGSVEATPTTNVFIRRTLGTMELTPGRQWLEVRPVRTNGTETVALNRIWLKRRID